VPSLPCIAVMAKRPQPGRVKTRLAASLGGGVAALLSEAFLRDTLRAMRSQTGAERCLYVTPASSEPWFAALDPDAQLLVQPELEFGARLAAGFGALFDAGLGPVIFVGADMPHLTPELLDEAFDALTRSDVVLGPCDDGGYYLIGLAAERPRLFDGVRWSTPETLSDTVARAEAHGLSVHLTAESFDVDEIDDLRRLAALEDLADRCPSTAAALESVDLG